MQPASHTDLWTITDSTPPIEESLYGPLPRVKTAVEFAVDGSIEIVPWTRQGKPDLILEHLGTSLMPPYGKVQHYLHLMDLNYQQMRSDLDWSPNPLMPGAKGSFWLVSHFDPEECHCERDDWWVDYQRATHEGFPYIFAQSEPRRMQNILIEVGRGMEFAGAYKFNPLRQIYNSYLNNMVMKTGNNHPFPGQRPSKSFNPGHPLTRAFFDRVIELNELFEHSGVDRVWLEAGLMSPERCEPIFKSVAGLRAFSKQVAKAYNDTHGPFPSPCGTKMLIMGECCVGATPADEREIKRLPPYKLSFEYAELIMGALIRHFKAMVAVPLTAATLSLHNGPTGGAPETEAVSQSPGLGSQAEGLGSQAEGLGSQAEDSPHEKARKVAYYANLAASMAEEKTKEAERKERAAASRAARLAAGEAPYTVTIPRVGKQKATGRARTTEQQLVHQEHVSPRARILRKAAFDAKQAREHQEAEARRLRAEADDLKEFAANIAKDEAAASHHVPAGPTLAAFIN